jgi:tetratricopeptide (TPR) repeat protein
MGVICRAGQEVSRPILFGCPYRARVSADPHRQTHLRNRDGRLNALASGCNLRDIPGGTDMKITANRLTVVIALSAVLAGWMFAQSNLGTIDFATSAAPAAQAPFIDGVKLLHSFQFDEAAVAFRQAQKADPGFALAYWGEAMSFNHPLWAQVDVDAAKKALEKLAPTAAARIEKAKTVKEKAYVEAVHQLFYSPGDKLARDKAYSAAMEKMYQQWPDDAEIDIFYALSLLGTVRPGDRGFKRQTVAAAISEKVFRDNPNHPGAAHFIIHSFDDPDHAILGLPAARAYAKIAPSAAHALHMPSHIFVQLGMWEDVVASNVAAYKAAVDGNQRLRLPDGREDFHTLSWLTYANLMLGKFDEAIKNVETAKQTADRNPGNVGVHNGYLGMRARYILETRRWERIPVEDASASAGSSQSNMPAMPGMPGMNRGAGGNPGWTFIAGFSAAKLGDIPTAQKAEAQLRAARMRTEAAGNAYAAKPVAIMEKEIAAVTKFAQGQKDDAVILAKEAGDIEQTMSAPSGPPEPMKPALELYADLLMETGRSKEAVTAYEAQLERTPNRTPSVKGLAAAKSKSGTSAQ